MKINPLTPESQTLGELGKRLARVRKQQGYTQDKLAAAAGLGVATLRRIEDGQDSQLSSWLKLLKALQMTAAIDALVPEDFRSPMAEALAESGKRHRPRAASADASIWRDEKDTT